MTVEITLESVSNGPISRTEAVPTDHFQSRLGNELEALGETLLLMAEALGGKLYTGPLFVKYNDILRKFGPALAGCLGNRYVTTIHVINSCIVKGSKLTVVGKVYRGVSGGLLPNSFWEANNQGVRGGVEMAFLSTTFDRASQAGSF